MVKDHVYHLVILEVYMLQCMSWHCCNAAVLQDTTLIMMHECTHHLTLHLHVYCCTCTSSNVWSYTWLCSIGLHIGITTNLDMVKWSRTTARHIDHPFRSRSIHVTSVHDTNRRVIIVHRKKEWPIDIDKHRHKLIF